MQTFQKNILLKNQIGTQTRKISAVHFLCMFLMIVILVSCKSNKNVVSTNISSSSPEAVKAENRIVELINQNRQTTQSMTSKLNLQLVSGSKKVSVGGSLRMKRNDVIQITLSALGLFDLGCMELTPDYLLVVNRVDHQYIKVEYKEVEFLKKAGIDFFVFQSLFWDELFLFKGKGTKPSAKDFDLTRVSDGIKLINEDSKWMALTFWADVIQNMVSQTTISGLQSSTKDISLEWQYRDYSKLGEKKFPTQMQININTGKKPIQAILALSNLRANDGWEKRTEINTKKYSQVSLDTVLDRIMKLAK